MSRKAYLDGDVLVYQAGFGSDAAAKEKGFVHEDLSFCLHGCKKLIHALVEEAGADEYVVFLSHPVNERESIFPEYKANRDPTHKPYWYGEIAEYLLEHHGALYSSFGVEADDAMGIAQMQSIADDEESIIVTNDKDLDMIPGLHLNFSKTKRANGVYEIADPEGLRIFYRQMLTGDGTDNIPGMFKQLGVKATEKWKLPLEAMTNNREMKEYIRSIYKDDEFVNMIGKLLWIHRQEGDWWSITR